VGYFAGPRLSPAQQLKEPVDAGINSEPSALVSAAAGTAALRKFGKLTHHQNCV
jgi:hypothetical protein